MKQAFIKMILLPILIFSGNFQVKGQSTINLSELQDEAVDWLQDYIRINTVNPPGNEIAGAAFFAKIFEQEGIPYEIAESESGRGNIWAWIDGGEEPGLVLLHHMDVVPADQRYWTVDPLSGKLNKGYIYGRGTLDTKTGGILHLTAFIALHRSGIPLKRKVLFMATADEEAGGFYGAGWLVKNRPELFENIGYLLNEGGGGTSLDGRISFSVEVTQKVPYWLHLSATGEAGHGSRPTPSYATLELIAALERLRLHEFETRIIPVADTYFRGIADSQPEPWRSRFKDLASVINDPGVRQELQKYNPGLYGLTCNTCSITRLQGSNKINVIAPEAWAEVDCRLLPDQDPELWLSEVRQILGEHIKTEVLMGFTPAISDKNTELYEIIKEVTLESFPEASFVPEIMTGFTDSHFFRDIGIVCYGYEATATPAGDQSGVHGNDERVTVQNVRQGVEITLKILERFASSGSVLKE